ncbi:MAG: flagellar filament capping protein FliD [Bryobacterales bacterium]|nr:flagellar filament capping protein FliD [Bryobacterales bacterium]
MATSSIFNGASRYSNDFQAVIDRAVAIRSLGLQSLSQGRERLSAQSAAMNGLRTTFNSLRASLDAIGTSLGGSSLSASVSDGAIAKVNIGANALPGAYSLEVVSLGSFTNTLSTDGLPAVADPTGQSISASGSFTLTVNGDDFDVAPEANSLTSLVSAINQSGAGVEASIVNLGSTATPDYRLSLRALSLGSTTIQLNDGSSPLLDTIATGTMASYKVNGLSTAIESDSRTITLAPDLTVDLLGQSQPGVAMSITVSRSTAALGGALGSFASAYNAAVDEIGKHRGEQAGALAGESLLSTLAANLRAVSSYANTGGPISNLDQLGVSFNDQGRLIVDPAALGGKSFDALQAFLGSPSGSGFLAGAAATLDALTTDTSGLLPAATDSLTAQIKTQDDRIEVEQTRIDTYRDDLQSRIAAADAVIAALEQQVVYVQGLFSAFFDNQNGRR